MPAIAYSKRKSAISVVVWLDDEVVGLAAVWLSKAVMWTDLSQLCNSCQCVNSWDVLSTPATLTTSIYAAQPVRLWRDEAWPRRAQKVGHIAVIEFTLGDLVVDNRFHLERVTLVTAVVYPTAPGESCCLPGGMGNLLDRGSLIPDLDSSFWVIFCYSFVTKKWCCCGLPVALHVVIVGIKTCLMASLQCLTRFKCLYYKSF